MADRKIWNPEKQAQRVVRRGLRIGETKPTTRAEQKGKFYSIAAADKATGNLKRVASDMRKRGVPIDEMSTEQAQAWLDKLPARGVTQGTISSYKNALECCAQVESLTAPHATVARGEKATAPRAPTPEQTRLILSHQTERMRLVSELVADTGMRAKETLYLRRLDRVPDNDKAWRKFSRRQWDERRWDGKADGVRYLTTGKNGLPRIVAIRPDLAERLEARRLDQPREICDRKILLQQHYNVPGGKAWSQSFTNAAHAALGDGKSPGGHSLRHAFAQDRVDHYIDAGFGWSDALALVAQEMGHFRPDSTLAYLREEA